MRRQLYRTKRMITRWGTSEIATLRPWLPHALWEQAERVRHLVELGVQAGTARTVARDLGSWPTIERSRLTLLPPGALHNVQHAVDVGANVGDWTGALLRLTTPKVVRLFEPDPKVADDLAERFNNEPAVQVRASAVGAVSGIEHLHLTGNSLLNSIRRPTDTIQESYPPGADYTVRQKLAVPVVSLDEALDDLPSVDILKIDVQGFEEEVLAGARSVTARTRFVLLEANLYHHYEDDLLFGDLHALMTDLSFTLVNLSPPEINKGRALWADALYERQDLKA